MRSASNSIDPESNAAQIEVRTLGFARGLVGRIKRWPYNSGGRVALLFSKDNRESLRRDFSRLCHRLMGGPARRKADLLRTPSLAQGPRALTLLPVFGLKMCGCLMPETSLWQGFCH